MFTTWTKHTKFSVQTKQIMLAAVACIDANGQLINKSITQQVPPKISSKLLDQIVNIKQVHNTSNTVLLCRYREGSSD